MISLILAGCGDDKRPSGGAEDARSPNGDPAYDQDLPGVWASDGNGEFFTLVIVGDRTLMRWKDGPDGLCNGDVMRTESSTDLMFQCSNTPQEHEKGTVEYLEDGKLRVNWQEAEGSRGDSNFARIADAPAKLPKTPEDLPGI
ncbi:hypothetical protein [Streptomyces albiaxialis]